MLRAVFFGQSWACACGLMTFRSSCDAELIYGQEHDPDLLRSTLDYQRARGEIICVLLIHQEPLATSPSNKISSSHGVRIGKSRLWILINQCLITSCPADIIRWRKLPGWCQCRTRLVAIAVFRLRILPRQDQIMLRNLARGG
jgi:hypothetical protein